MYDWGTECDAFKVWENSESLQKFSITWKSNSNPVWILTVETLLDKLQHEWNSLTKLHKRGQNPHGECHNRASSSNEILFNQSSRFHCLDHNNDPVQFHAGSHANDALQLNVVVFFIIQSLYFSFWHFNPPPPPSHPYTTTHTCIPATPPLLARTSWCAFHLILFNEPHFTVRSLMTLIN